MKVRSVYIRDFRSFRGENTISFVDPLTDNPFPLSVLSGVNGSGKTTVLDGIAAAWKLAQCPDDTDPFVKSLLATGLICVEFEGHIDGVEGKQRAFVALGSEALIPEDHEARWPDLFAILAGPQGDRRKVAFGTPRQVGDRAPVWFKDLLNSTRAGGLLYFPGERRLSPGKGGPIEAPPEISRFDARVGDLDGWQGSLEQYWVWLNYLDLEEGKLPGERLSPFIERLSSLLGRGRQLYVRKGRIYVASGRADQPDARMDELPSGEKQILLMVGELIRRMRPGMACLIDEPEASLHSALQHALIFQLRKCALESDIQFILATHSLEIVQALPTSVVFLDHLIRTTSPYPSIHHEAAA